MIKIGSNAVDKINSEYIRNEVKRIKRNEEDNGSFSSEDKVELSSQATDLKNIQAQTMALPDVRSEKVEQLRMKVENGTYQIDNQAIAERLIDEAVENLSF